jgi:hypothetical protein
VIAIQVWIQKLSPLILFNLHQAVHGVEPNQSIKKMYCSSKSSMREGEGMRQEPMQ